MLVISISGATSRSGKTSLAVTLSSSLPAGTFKCVKFTTTEDEHVGCPRGSACTVCDIDVDFRLITDPVILLERDTDTARLSASGAAEVFWVIAKFSAMQRAWKAVKERVSPHDILIVEGSTILQAVRPDLSFYVVNPAHPPKRWKKSALDLIPSSDFICVNFPSRKKQYNPADESLNEVRRIRNRNDILLVDVQQELVSWPTLEPMNRIRRLQAESMRLSTLQQAGEKIS